MIKIIDKILITFQEDSYMSTLRIFLHYFNHLFHWVNFTTPEFKQNIITNVTCIYVHCAQVQGPNVMGKMVFLCPWDANI
jgi:hypothetical protein